MASNPHQQTLIDVEAIVHMWRAGLLSDLQAVSDISDQLEIHDEVVNGSREEKDQS